MNQQSPESSARRETALAMMQSLDLDPDPWQLEVLTREDKRLLLNCSRQAGKSTTVAMLSVMEAVGRAGTKVLLLSRSYRQAKELFGLVARILRRVGSRRIKRATADELWLHNFSRIICLPCKEETVRGYSDVGLLVIDEAARVPDDLYLAVRPMLAVSNGRLVCLSTPCGKRGFFWDAWSRGGDDWVRVEVPAGQVPRIRPEFLEQERRVMGEAYFRQEFCCSFEAAEGLVYPDFGKCVVAGEPPPGGRRVGGIDFGLRNPFAAVWGVLDRDDVLWLTGEHYCREQTLAYHARHLPKGLVWYADPAGAREILELRCADVRVQKADNDVMAGIMAVRSRLLTGRLKVVAGRCPNLLAEAGLYRYDPEEGSERPLKEHDHAMDALRYLVSELDARWLARYRRTGAASGLVPDSLQPSIRGDVPASEPAAKPKRRPWLSIYNEALWTRLQ
jgi:hypothetical protein